MNFDGLDKFRKLLKTVYLLPLYRQEYAAYGKLFSRLLMSNNLRSWKYFGRTGGSSSRIWRNENESHYAPSLCVRIVGLGSQTLYWSYLTLAADHLTLVLLLQYCTVNYSTSRQQLQWALGYQRVEKPHSLNFSWKDQRNIH